MKKETREWLKERAAFGSGTKAKEIMDYIIELERSINSMECSLSERLDLMHQPAEY